MFGVWVSGIVWVVSALGRCHHNPITRGEGKFYCPQCGQGVIARWVVLRCQACHGRRQSRYWMRQVLPSEKNCLHCGEAAYRLEYLDFPAYYQLHQALLIFQSEQEFMTQRPVPLWVKGIKVWLEPASSSPRLMLAVTAHSSRMPERLLSRIRLQTASA